MTPASPDPGAGGRLRVRLDLGYDGSGFSGWARQPGLRTVQGELEAALGTVLRVPPPQLTVAGRTDAGVHARGQVCHLDVAADALAACSGRSGRPPTEALLSRLAGVLSADVVVHRAQVVPTDFDARFSALGRRYSYRVVDGPVRPDPLIRTSALWHRRELDTDRMNAASALLLGEHDFAAYCRPRAGASTVRELVELSWARSDAHQVVATVRADAFCHHQVRSLVGAVLAVGDGARPVDWPRQVLAAARRDSTVQVVAAHGLVLEEIGYPAPELWAARSAATRRYRGSPDAEPGERPGSGQGPS